MSESLTNDQKIRIMELAHAKSDFGAEDHYRTMIDLIENNDPEKDQDESSDE